MSQPVVTTRAGHPDFLDLDWASPLAEWTDDRLVDLPRGIHRHVVRFVALGDRTYAIKELPRRLAHHEYDMLRWLESTIQPVAQAVGVVARPWVDPSEEWSAAVITEYVRFAFPYRELIEGGGFGRNRDRMLDAFASLLVELHLVGCFWGDCSLSNVLYRWDGGAIQAIMIDAETVELHTELSEGQRLHDLEIMRVNVAGGMADVAASQGVEIDRADMELGEDVIRRYHSLWDELTEHVRFMPGEQYRVRDKVTRLNELGFEVADLEFRPSGHGPEMEAHLEVAVGGRSYHTSRLRELANVEATEHSARRILGDLSYYQATHPDAAGANKAVAAILWRVEVFEPLLATLASEFPEDDPVNRYSDFLHHRYLMATAAGRDIPTDEAFQRWVADGGPGIPPA